MFNINSNDYSDEDLPKKPIKKYGTKLVDVDGPPELISDEDDDEDIDVVDEDAAMKAAERAQQMEEINDLEREVEIQRQKLAGQKNQLLRDKTMKQLRSLEEDLRIKKGGLGMQDEDDDEE